MKEEENIYRGNKIEFRKKKGKVNEPALPKIIDVSASPKDTSASKESNQQKKEPMSDFISKCRDLIVKNKIEKALELMMNSAHAKEDNDIRTAILMQSGKFHSLESDIVNGTQSFANINLSKSRLTMSLLKILENMEDMKLDNVEEDESDVKEEPKVKPKANDNLKILFLAANPSDGTRLKIAEECRDIETVLKMAMDRDKFEMKSEWAVTPSHLQQAILDENPNIVHFSGHGEEEGILLQDAMGYSKVVDENALTNLFGLFKDSINCVILNSCYSKSQAEAIAKHIKYVIGMKKAVPDKTAQSFAVGFYRALGAGKDIEFAYKFGLNAVELDGVTGSDIPLLFRQV